MKFVVDKKKDYDSEREVFSYDEKDPQGIS